MTTVRLTASAMVAGGDALARDAAGRVVFVEGALPGEEIVAEVTEERRDFARAGVVEVLTASPVRVAPPCAARIAGCGGCAWQHVSVAAQPALKRDIVVDALRRIARLDPPAVQVVALPAGGYRTTARVAVEDGRAGFHERHGSRVVHPDACAVAHPRLAELVIDGRFGAARSAVLRVSAATGERVALVDPSAGGVALPADVAVAGAGDRARLALREQVAGRWFRVSARSFFQSGPAAAAALAEAAHRASEDVPGPLVDLYAGVGLFASVLGARRGAPVLAVESSASAVADARRNLADLDARVVRAQVGRWRPAGSPRPAVVVADPARPGLGRPGAATVLHLAAPRVVLVSCDPASFARDAVLLSAGGYALSVVTLVDAFPQTPHIETVASFDRHV